MSRKLLIFFLLAGLLAACREEDNPTVRPPAGNTPAAEGTPASVAEATTAPTSAPEPTPTLTPTPLPRKHLVVCLGGEPVEL